MGRAGAVHYAAAVALSFTSLPSPASGADFNTGNELLAACAGGGGEKLQCIAYMDGVLHGLLFMSIRDETKMPFCAPEAVTKGQAIDVVVKYLRDNPEERHIAASVIVAYSMSKAFPCAQK